MEQNAPKSPIAELKDNLFNATVEKKWALSCYIPVFNIVSCVLTAVRMAASSFCLFHARQGLVLFGLWLATLVLGVFRLQTLSLMLLGVVLVLHGAGLFIAYNMKETQIPIIGQIALRIPPLYLFKRLTGRVAVENDAQANHKDDKGPSASTVPGEVVKVETGIEGKTDVVRAKEEVAKKSEDLNSK